MAAIRVGIVDDHTLVRDGLRLILSGEPDIEVIGEASDIAGAIAMVRLHKPDIMLVDLTLHGSDGVGLVRDLTHGDPKVRVIAVTMHQHDETVRQVFLAGASGYVVKGAPSADLVSAVRSVANNQHYVHPTVAEVVVVDSLRWLRHGGRLSPRELEVLQLAASGRTAAESGRDLGISAHTVRRHLSNVSQKVGVHGRIALARYAYDHHLVSDND